MILHTSKQEKSDINHAEEQVVLLTQNLPIMSQIITKTLHFAGFPVPSTTGAFGSHRAMKQGFSQSSVMAAVTLFTSLPLAYRSS